MILFLDFRTSAKNAARGDPAVDVSPVIADLETWSLDRFDDVEVFATPDFAQHYVTYLDGNRTDRLNSTKLPGFDFARHRVAARPKRYRLSVLKSCNVMRCPAHDAFFREFVVRQTNRSSPTMSLSRATQVSQ